MKIAYITSQFPAPSETFACSDIRVIKKMGHMPQVFCMLPKHKDHEQMLLDRQIGDIPVVPCELKQNLLGLVAVFFHPLMALNLVAWFIRCRELTLTQFVKCLVFLPSVFFIFKKISTSRPDIVHLFWGHYPSLVGHLVKRYLPEAKLTIFLGAYDLELNLGISTDMAKRADYVFTHARANLLTLKKMGILESSVQVVHRGVDLEYFSDALESKPTRDHDRFFSAGRIIQSKGFDKVLSISSQFKDKKVVIAGTGPFLKELKSLAKELRLEDRVEFLGFLPQKQLFLEMQKSTYFLMLSEKEGERLPNVVKEAMLAGCVCIVSQTPGIDELIDDGKTGFIIDSNQLDKAVKIIERLSSEECRKIGDMARESIQKSFSAERLMKEYIHVWEKDLKPQMQQAVRELPFISVICPVFNAEAYLPKLISALWEQTYPKDHFEVIFVDNGSTDGSLEILKKSGFKWAQRLDVSSSYAARNEGLKKARGEVIAFVDADCTPAPEWLEKGVEALREISCDLLGGRIEFRFRNGRTAWEFYDSLYNNNNRVAVKRGHSATANLFCTKHVIETLGHFNEDFCSGEDFVWTHQAVQKGLRLGYGEKAFVYHPTRDKRELLHKSLRVGCGFLNSYRVYSTRLPKSLLCIAFVTKNVLPPSPFRTYHKLKENESLSFSNFFTTYWVTYVINLYRARGLVEGIFGAKYR